jgi:small GTP-binding protein
MFYKLNSNHNNMNDEIYDYKLKFIIIGDSNVGKSNLLLQFTDNKFIDHHDLTIGVEFGMKHVEHNNTKYRILIWDTAGQEAFQSLTKNYYKDAIGCLLVFDITRKESFENIIKWKKRIEDNANKNTVIILIGNKNDREENRKVSKEEILKFANENNIVYFETSAKKNINVDESFMEIIRDVDNKIKNNEIDLETKLVNGIESHIKLQTDLEIEKNNKLCYFW